MEVKFISVDEFILMEMLLHVGSFPLDRIASLSTSEVQIDALMQLGLIVKRDDQSIALSPPASFILTELQKRGLHFRIRRGNSFWHAVQPIFESRNFNQSHSTCFILMPFTLKWSDRIWTLLQEIIPKSEFNPIRADDLYGHEVMEDIWSAINGADIVVADLTGRNPNVFYELGIAHTVGTPTVLLSQSTKDIPFDLSGKRCILYEDNADGYEILRNQLPAMIEQTRVESLYSKLNDFWDDHAAS